MYCYRCGAYISERDTECYMCGSSINAQKEMLVDLRRRQRKIDNLRSEIRTQKEKAAKQEADKKKAEKIEAESNEALRYITERQEAARREAERLEAERQEAARQEAESLEAERREAERLAAEQEARRIEEERQEATRREAERLESERQEATRREAERLESERQEAARREAERLEAERQEAARREAERLESERQEAARREAERLEAERQEAARREAERLEAEREARRIEAEREAARIEAERQETMRREAERLAAEREAARLKAEREAAARQEALRLAAEREEAARREGERAEAERLAGVQREVLRQEAARQASEEQAAKNIQQHVDSPVQPDYIPPEVSAGREAVKQENVRDNKAGFDNAYRETRQERSSYPPVPPAGTQGSASGDRQNNIIMQVFCFIAAGLFVWSAVSQLSYVLYSISYPLSNLLMHPIGYALSFVGGLLELVAKVVTAGIAALFVVTALRWAKEKAESYFAVTAVASVLMVLVRLLGNLIRIAAMWIAYRTTYFSFASETRSLLFCAAILAAYYGVNAVCGVILFKGMTGEQIKDIFMAAPASIMAAIKKNGTSSAATDFGPGARKAADLWESNGHQKPVGSDERVNERTAQDSNEKPRPETRRQANNYYTGPAAANTEPLSTNRGIIKFIILTILTCGIYGLYVIHKIAKDVNIACDGDGKTTAGLLKLIIFSALTCGIYTWIWYYNLGNRLQENAPRYGMHFSENGTTILMWELFGILLCGIGPFIALNIVFTNTNSLCAAYNEENGFYSTN